MSTSLIFVLIAVILLLSFAYIATRRAASPPDLEQALVALRSLDIEAFRNLIDRKEEDYLRDRLPAREFRRVRRARGQAALAYVNALSKASLQLARFGSAAQRSPDSEIAESGRQIANSAIYLRLRALQATMQLTLVTVFPAYDPRPLRSLLDQYDDAAHRLVRHNVIRREAA